MYFKSNVKVRTAVYSYELLSMVAEVGGYTGLLLGVSFFELTKIIDWVIARLRQKS